MTATLTRPTWTTEFEIETIDKLVAQYAPHFPTTRFQEPRQLTTQEEFENFYRFRIGGAAHDLYIVQVCSKVIDQIPDPELQLFLSRQIGDDGAHSQFTRQRVWELSGCDPLDKIVQEVEKHWDFMGNLPIRSWLGFVAFELHYELHIVAQLILNSRTTTITDPETSKFASQTILPDEAAHRLGVLAWWQSKYDKLAPTQKAEIAAQLLELDEEGQRRRNGYLKEHWQIVHRATGAEIEGLEVVYDAWRQEVLAYFLDIPIAKLPQLVSVSE
ncbi:hypothetical protein QUB80_25680 [Chlorogloeopsis sp. ULAP01]|uniref:hypothetical protein n=1 Tax=Chlorogloeopsis sp. ULAP01 TaxID=3056483 RepID=UPI0025AA6A72|nr:hypothetical protein [Chlorogloeopsis sp. ULAP01]MDM9384072.1 hypothetical protein [Chlorogloeopsis sp. ULAP01]